MTISRCRFVLRWYTTRKEHSPSKYSCLYFLSRQMSWEGGGYCLCFVHSFFLCSLFVHLNLKKAEHLFENSSSFLLPNGVVQASSPSSISVSSLEATLLWHLRSGKIILSSCWLSCRNLIHRLVAYTLWVFNCVTKNLLFMQFKCFSDVLWTIDNTLFCYPLAFFCGTQYWTFCKTIVHGIFHLIHSH